MNVDTPTCKSRFNGTVCPSSPHNTLDLVVQSNSLLDHSHGNSSIGTFGAVSNRSFAHDSSEEIEEEHAPPCRQETKPKRALTCNNIFLRCERKRLLAEISATLPKGTRPKIDFEELGRKISAQWKKTPLEERHKYRRMAARDRQRYERQMEEWHNYMGSVLNRIVGAEEEQGAAPRVPDDSSNNSPAHVTYSNTVLPPSSTAPSIPAATALISALQFSQPYLSCAGDPKANTLSITMASESSVNHPGATSLHFTSAVPPGPFRKQILPKSREESSTVTKTPDGCLVLPAKQPD